MPRRCFRRKGIFSAGLAVLAAAFTGCATSPEITSWNMAKEVNTLAAYQDYIRRYPDGSHAEEARERIGKSKMDRILKAATVEECVRIQKEYTDPKTTATIADLAFQAAMKETSVESLYEFLVNFKEHKGVPEVRRRLEELEFRAAVGDPSPGAMEFFLLRYPGSSFAAEGRKSLEEKLFAKVKAWGNPFGYKAFLLRFPDSPRAAEVRGWVRPGAQVPGTDESGETPARLAEKIPWMKRYGCAVALSSRIRSHTGDVDSLRIDLREIEKWEGAGDLPASCGSAAIVARRGTEASLAQALRALSGAQERRNELAQQWNVYVQREELVKGAIGASLKVADELETAELSEDVLGSGPLGGLDVGKEKGSVSAKKALERFREAQTKIRKVREEIKRLLVETEGMYRPLQQYAVSCLAAE